MTEALALVTGSSGGIGSALAAEFSADHRLITQDLSEGDGRSARHVQGNLVARAALTALDDAVGDAPLNLLVLAHGVAAAVALEDLNRQAVQRVMGINFASHALLVERFADRLAAAQGTVLAVVSQAGLEGEANNSVYCASKFAMVGWSRARAAELAKRRVRMRLLCPGCVDTDLLDGAIRQWATQKGMNPDEVKAARVKKIPLGRMADPVEVAAAGRHLVALESSRLVILNQSGGETFNP